jgi:hypothetical protein
MLLKLKLILIRQEQLLYGIIYINNYYYLDSACLSFDHLPLSEARVARGTGTGFVIYKNKEDK